MGLLCKINFHENHKFKTDAPGTYLECKKCGLRQYKEKDETTIGYRPKLYDRQWVEGKGFLPRDNKDIILGMKPKRI